MNSTNMTTLVGMNSTTMPNLSPSEDIEPALRIRNQVILPIFTTLGLCINTFTFFVACRPKPRTLYFNLYVQAISLLDMLGFLLRLPIIFDNEYCGYLKYSMAFYMTYFGWQIINILRAINSYVLVLLSFDRFMAIWFPKSFKNTKGTKRGMKRLIMIASLVFLTDYIPWMTRFLKVSPIGHQWFMNYMNPGQSKEKWFKVFEHYNTFLLTAAPSILVIGLNIGIAVGFFKKKIYTKSHGKRDRAARKRFYQTIAVLALNGSYAVFCFPYMVTVLYVDRGFCYRTSSYALETMIYLLESLSSLWSISNMLIFFLFNKEYTNEIKKICGTLPFVKNYIPDPSDTSIYSQPDDKS